MKAQLDDFHGYLLAEGRSAGTIKVYLGMVRRFLKHIGDTRIDRISEELTRAYFLGIRDKRARCQTASVVSQYLRFTARNLPVVINARGADAPRAPKQIALRQRWSIDKLIEQKAQDNDLIAKLARKVIDAYLLSGDAIKGDFNLDDFVRFHDEARDIIESNLALFMGLSAGGRNIHSAIEERLIR